MLTHIDLHSVSSFLQFTSMYITSLDIVHFSIYWIVIVFKTIMKTIVEIAEFHFGIVSEKGEPRYVVRFYVLAIIATGQQQ